MGPHLRSRALACNVPSSFKEFLTSEPLDQLTSLSSWISGPFATSACTGSFSNSSSWSTLPEILEISSAKSNSPSTYIVAACLAIASMIIGRDKKEMKTETWSKRHHCLWSFSCKDQNVRKLRRFVLFPKISWRHLRGHRDFHQRANGVGNLETAFSMKMWKDDNADVDARKDDSGKRTSSQRVYVVSAHFLLVIGSQTSSCWLLLLLFGLKSSFFINHESPVSCG